MIRGRRLFGLAVRAASSQASGHLPLSTLKRPSIDAVQDFAERIRLIGAGTVELRRWEHDNRVLELVLRNGKRKNALTGRMMVQLRDFVEALSGDEYRDAAALVLRGEDKTFCSGADLDLAKAIQSSTEGALMCELMTSTLTAIRRLPLITISIIEGYAIGGGAELATTTDYRLMSVSARIQFVQAKMGVSTGWGGGARLVKLLGRRQALTLLGTAAAVDAAHALQMGLVDDLLPEDGDADVTVTAFARPFLKPAHATEALRAIKSTVAAADDHSLDEAREEEALAFQSVWAGPANLRALKGGNRRTA